MTWPGALGELVVGDFDYGGGDTSTFSLDITTRLIADAILISTTFYSTSAITTRLIANATLTSTPMGWPGALGELTLGDFDFGGGGIPTFSSALAITSRLIANATLVGGPLGWPGNLGQFCLGDFDWVAISTAASRYGLFLNVMATAEIVPLFPPPPPPTIEGSHYIDTVLVRRDDKPRYRYS